MAGDSRVILLPYIEPERICTAAARLSTKPGTCSEILDAVDPADPGNTIKNVVKLGHTSVVEHACFTVAFENVSAFIEQFVIEFRLGSYTVKSRRYVDFGDAGYVVPFFSIEDTEQEHLGFADAEEEPERFYVMPELAYARHGGAFYRKYVDHMNFLFGEYRHLVASGVPIEDARFLLPYSFKSNFFCTMNARELGHFLKAALYGRGRKYREVNTLAKNLKEQLEAAAPRIFGDVKKPKGEDKDEEGLSTYLGKRFASDRPAYRKAHVELLSYTPRPERVVATAAAVKRTQVPTPAIKKGLNRNSTKKLIEAVLTSKRPRELEQVNFTFRISNISLPTLTHVARHRMQSLVVPDFTEVGKNRSYVNPETIKADKKLYRRYRNAVRRHRHFYQEAIEPNLPPEERIYTYISGNTIDVVTTMNARELLFFFSLRTCERAQWEVRSAAKNMLKKVKRVAPNIFAKAGPNCYTLGYCTEGKMNCGRMEEVVAEFAKL
jgi:flavin-dependent thymidylate synthase